MFRSLVSRPKADRPALLLAALGFPGAVLGLSSGPPADRVALCGARESCNTVGCHTGLPTNPGLAEIRLELQGGGVPTTYSSDEVMDLDL